MALLIYNKCPFFFLISSLAGHHSNIILMTKKYISNVSHKQLTHFTLFELLWKYIYITEIYIYRFYITHTLVVFRYGWVIKGVEGLRNHISKYFITTWHWWLCYIYHHLEAEKVGKKNNVNRCFPLEFFNICCLH